MVSSSVAQRRKRQIYELLPIVITISSSEWSLTNAGRCMMASTHTDKYASHFRVLNESTRCNIISSRKYVVIVFVSLVRREEACVKSLDATILLQLTSDYLLLSAEESLSKLLL